jgi:mannose-6-phosphate isomerase
MYLLENRVRDYAWGSRTHLPRFLGREPDGRPWAELWMGAHPSAPSRLPDGTTLDVAITRDAEALLGHDTRATFGDRLPFLMKLLAAAEPLSLQVHPTTDRARIRCAEQDAAGIPRDAAERTYPDASHKPEMIYALTRFEGMAGFRDPAKTAPILRGLELPWLDQVADRIEGSPTPFQTLRDVVTGLLAMAGPELAGRLEELRLAAEKAELRAHSTHAGRRVGALPDPTAVERESVRVYAAVARLVEQYPADPGVLVTLLLNHVVLAPGEAMFIDAGVIHAYASGFGVEIMAASDNVLRAGLTVKHVDVPELIEVANFTPMPPPLWAGAATADPAGGTVFTPPVDEFELAVLPVQGGEVALRDGPQLLLCLDGTLQACTTAGRLDLPAGSVAYVGGAEERVTVSGQGRLVVGRTP